MTSEQQKGIASALIARYITFDCNYMNQAENILKDFCFHGRDIPCMTLNMKRILAICNIILWSKLSDTSSQDVEHKYGKSPENIFYDCKNQFRNLFEILRQLGFNNVISIAIKQISQSLNVTENIVAMNYYSSVAGYKIITFLEERRESIIQINFEKTRVFLLLDVNQNGKITIYELKNGDNNFFKHKIKHHRLRRQIYKIMTGKYNFSFTERRNLIIKKISYSVRGYSRNDKGNLII